MKNAFFLFLLIGMIGCSKSSDSPAAATGDSCGNDEATTTYLKICSFVATPTASESVTLKNYDASAYTLTNWKLCDKNAYDNSLTGCQSLSSTVITAKGTVTLASLPFQINDSAETIYLVNDAGTVVHTKAN